ncbi:MAG TPA: PAS domain S-box protein, partial [Vicinamibacteria bacterium]|nr:PAS domain S-box protein [Vicinamibacteria bacterium]
MNDFPRLLLEAIDDLAVVGLDLDGRIAVWSGGAERLVGYAAPEIVGRPASVLYPAEEAAAGRPQDDLRRAAEGAGLERAGWCVRKDGSRFRARLAVRPLRASGGRPAGFAWIAGEGAARAGAAGPGEEDARLRALVEQAPFSIQVFGRDGRCLSVNAAWARLWESRPEEVRDYNILRDPQVAERGLLGAVERAFRGERCTLPPVLY